MWNALLALPWLQEYLITLVCFYRGIWSRALLRNSCSVIHPLRQLFILFQYLFFTLMNPSLTKCYSQCSSHVTDSVVWMDVFSQVWNLSAKLWDSPSRPHVVGVMPEGCSWCSVLTTLGTALELRVSCMDGDQQFAGCCPECLGQCLSLHPRYI